MDSKLVLRFLEEVNELITVDQEKEILFESLKNYHASSDIRKLVQDLKKVLNDPTKLEIYESVRPLIRPQHQQQYDKMTPSNPGQKLRVIRLRRKFSESLGFAVRGGFEHGIGVFVSHVQQGSQAELQGLKVGDEIVRVNGFTIAEAIHEEVLNLIKGREEIELKVTNIGMLPIKESPTDPVTWEYVEKNGRTQQKRNSRKNQKSSNPESEDIKIFINLRGASSLGCSIVSGPQHYPGIFVESVKPGSLGEDYGLEVGDQLIEVNGTSFHEVTHKEAVVELKGSKELNMIIRKGAGLPLFDKASPRGSPREVRKHVTQATVETPTRVTVQEDESEIFEEDPQAVEERRRWEEEDLARLKKQAEEEERRRKERERLEEERKEEQRRLEQQREDERRRKEQARKEMERLKLEEERRQREEEERRKQEEERRRQEEEWAREEEARRREEEEKQRQLEAQMQERISHKEKQRALEVEFYRRVYEHQEQEGQIKQVNPPRKVGKIEGLARFVTASNAKSSKKKPAPQAPVQSAVLAGRAAPRRNAPPTLLGAETPVQLSVGGLHEGKKVKAVVIQKDSDHPLDIEMEGGIGSPLGGKIVVADVYPGGAAYDSGSIKRGDQLLKVDGHSLLNVTLEQAQNILWEAEQSPGESMVLTIAETELIEDQVQKFYLFGEIPTSNVDDFLKAVQHPPVTFIE